jgi:uncharacterized membrane protein
MKERIKSFLLSLLSRKFLLAVGASLAAYGVATQDNTITQSELVTILAPIFAFIGVEGGADIVTRYTNITPVNDPKAQ